MGGEAAAEEGTATASTNEEKKLNWPIVWVDLEFSGLDEEKDIILEYAVVVTDEQLETVIEGPSGAIGATKERLDAMNDWCKKTHGESGLINLCLNTSKSMKEAEAEMLDFIKKYGGPRSMRLAGSSVHVDRLFLRKHMPEFEKYLHYGLVEVSTVRHLAYAWVPDTVFLLKKEAHRAMDDIKESIELLKELKQKIFGTAAEALQKEAAPEAKRLCVAEEQ